jgi:Plasmid pRiA4b ORF-3-like protein
MIGFVVRPRLVLRGVSPSIVRTIEVPDAVTLAVLNEAMVICFGWSGEHLHKFTIRAVGYSTDWAVDVDDSRNVTLNSLELRPGERFCWPTISSPAGTSTSALKRSTTTRVGDLVFCLAGVPANRNGAADT